MTKVGKAATWACIFSTLFMGCYSSTLIDPAGDEKEKIYSNEIEYLIAKDGTKYEFTRPPSIVDDTVVGEITVRMDDASAAGQVSIPTVDVAQLGQSQSGDITYVVTKAGAKYVFEVPPIIVDNAIVGTGKLTGGGRVVRIPLSVVGLACISELNGTNTGIAVVLGIVVVVLGVVAAVELSDFNIVDLEH